MINAAPDVDHLLGEVSYNEEPYNNAPQKDKIIYARISSSKQKADLDGQIEELKCFYPDHVIYKDTGSWLNYKR